MFRVPTAERVSSAVASLDLARRHVHVATYPTYQAKVPYRSYQGKIRQRESNIEQRGKALYADQPQSSPLLIAPRDWAERRRSIFTRGSAP